MSSASKTLNLWPGYDELTCFSIAILKTVCLNSAHMGASVYGAFLPRLPGGLARARGGGTKPFIFGEIVRQTHHLPLFWLLFNLHLVQGLWLGNAARMMSLIALLALSAGSAWAQGNSAATGTPTFILDQCKREVLAYQKNLETVRKSLGDKAAQEFADKFMTKEQWNESLLRDGYCAIARGLKANRLN